MEKNYEQSITQIWSKFENHITAKRFTFLSTYIFITTSKTYACQYKKKNISDNYNDISIDRFSSKTKTGKHSWYFSNSLLCKLDFRSAAKGLFPSLKNQKTVPP